MTLKELIYQEMLQTGVQEATAFRVTIPGEEPLLIANDNHPALEREVGDGSGIKFERFVSAKAGYSSSIAGRVRDEVKTGISLSNDLLNRAETVANEMKISPERLFAIAVEEFLQRQQTRKLVDSINEAYQDGPDEEESEWLRLSQQSYRKVLEKEEW